MKSKKISFYFLSVFWYVYIVGKLGSFNHVIEGVFLNNIFILSHLLGLKMFNIRLWKKTKFCVRKKLKWIWRLGKESMWSKRPVEEILLIWLYIRLWRDEDTVIVHF